MKKSRGRILCALMVLLMALEMAPLHRVFGDSDATGDEYGIMPIAAETLVSSSELSEFNQYWTLGGSVVIHETVASSGGLGSEVSALPLYINGSSSYRTPVENPIKGNYGIQNKTTGLYWLAYQYSRLDSYPRSCHSNGSDNHLSMDFNQGFKNGDHVTMSYAAQGVNLYKDEYGRIFFKVYCYMADGGFPIQLYRAYFTKTDIQVLYTSSMSSYPDNDNYIHAKNPSVNATAEALVNAYWNQAISYPYNGSTQNHPVYTALLTAGSSLKLSGSCSGKDVGQYPFFVSPNTGYTWSDGTTTQKLMILSITKADPTGTLPDLTVNPYSTTSYALTGGGALTPTSGVTYTSSDPDVGTFENGSFVSKGKLGKTTVTAAFPGDKNLNAGTWTGTVVVALSGGLYVEKDGEQTVYPSLREAYDALPAEGGTIHVLGNVTVDAGLVTTSGKNVTVVGEAGGDNGEVAPTLNRAGDFTTFTVENATLTLENLTVTAASGEAVNGGAVYVGTGGSLELGNGVQLTGNNASNKGGAVYVAANAGTVTVNGVTVQNNEAAFGNGIYLEDGATVTVAGSVRNLGDGIAIGYDESKTGTTNRGAVDVTTASALDAKLTVEFENPAAQLGGNNILYVKSETLTAAQLKSNLLVRNPGYTFGQETDSHGLSLTRADTIAAALQVDGAWKDYADPQEAINAAADGSTVYFATYTNEQNTDLNTTEVLISKTLLVEGKALTFASVNKHVPTSNVPEYVTSGVTVTLKRADGNTEALVKVSEGAALTLGDITLDGGAVWDGGSLDIADISDDGYGGAGTVTTGNTGITAHAPVVVNAGTLTITDGATIENNDNNYASPGAGFGSQNYGGGVRNEAGGVLTMTGGTIKDCCSREGGGIMNVRKPDESGAYAGAQAPSVTVSGGEITGCMSQQKGAAIQTIYGGAQTTVTTGANITGCASLNNLGVLSVEEGGTLTVSGGTVTATAGKNALYLYNKYSDEDYASAVTKPFIEGNAVGVLAVTGSPAITGNVHVDDSCVVVDTKKTYEAVVDLTGCGTAVTLDFTGGEKSFGTVAKWGSGEEPDISYDAPSPDGGSYAFYQKSTNGLSRSGYALEFTQAMPNVLEVSGTCDTAFTAFEVDVGGKTTTFELTDGVVSGTIEFDGAGTQTSFASVLKPTLNGAEQTFDGPELNVLLYNSTNKTFTVPADTKYVDETGEDKNFTGPGLPDDAAVSADGNVTFKVGTSVIIAHVGTPEKAPAFDGEVVTLADVTDGSLDLNVITTYQNLEFRLSYEDSAGITAYTTWRKSDASGKLTFTGLTPATEYTVLARTPAGAESLPSMAVPCPGGVFVTLTADQNTAKTAFEGAYDTWNGGTTTDPADALTKYDALANTLTGTTPKDQMAMDEVTTLESERLAQLQAARDQQAADTWVADYLSAIEDAVQGSAQTGTKATVGESIGAYDALPDGAKALVDDTLADKTLPDALTAYRSLTAAEIRSEAAAEPGMEDFCETYANAVQGAADKAAVDTAMANFETAIGPAKAAQTAYNNFVTANDLTPRSEALAKQALEQTYADIAAAAGDTNAMNNAVMDLDNALSHAKNAGDAFQDYLESRQAITGESLPVDAQTGLPTGTSNGVAEALDVAMALEAAADTAAMNELLKNEITELLDRAAQGGSTAVQDLAEEGKADIVSAADATGSGLADFSALVGEIMSKINSQRAAEQAASNAAALNAQKSAAAKKIEELAAQYDGTEMYSGAREELDSLKTSLLDQVEDTTLSGGLSQAQRALDSLVEQAETGFAKKAVQGQAQKEYLDGAESLTGAKPDPASSPVREALEAIASAEDTAGMNSALSGSLGALAEGLVDRQGDSDAVHQLADSAIDAMESAAGAAKDGEIADLTPSLETLRADIAAQRQAEIRAAQEEYMDAYNALTGENVTDLADARVKAAADAIGSAKNCGEANSALAKALDEALQAMKQTGDARQVSDYIDSVRDSAAAEIAGSGGNIAEVSGLLGGVRTEVDSLRKSAQATGNTGNTGSTGDGENAENTGSTGTGENTGDTGNTENNGNNVNAGGDQGAENTGSSENSSGNPSGGAESSGEGGDTGNPGGAGDQGGAASPDSAAKRAEFDRVKSELLDEAEKLVRGHDGEHVIDLHRRYTAALRDKEFSEDDPEESIEGLKSAFEEIKRETEQAQRLQRFENSARAQIAAVGESADTGELDALLARYMELANDLPPEGREGDPQSDIEELYGRFLAELSGMRGGPAVSPWVIAAGGTAVLVTCFIVVILLKRRKKDQEEAGR